jgi:hypothetical protein
MHERRGEALSVSQNSQRVREIKGNAQNELILGNEKEIRGWGRVCVGHESKAATRRSTVMVTQR